MSLKKSGFLKGIRAPASRYVLFLCLVVAGTILSPRASYSTDGGTSVYPGTASDTTAGGGENKSPCDPEYMDALEARAWMEAQREISQNQNLIYKPDSVLEYTCFDRFLNPVASNFPANRQFSETDRWDGRPVGFSAVTTDIALTTVVMIPFRRYLASNFDTSGGFNAGAYLNNRFEDEYTPQDTVNGAVPYTCDEMQKVWKFARCSNFISEKEYDGFYDFKYYENSSWDPRKEVNTWSLMCDAGDPRFTQGRQSAFNGDQDLFDVTQEIIEPEGNGTPYKEDDVVTHLDYILPGSCGHCIPTGICVQRTDLGRYLEQVCTNPGCPATQGGGC